jgi:LIM domain
VFQQSQIQSRDNIFIGCSTLFTVVHANAMAYCRRCGDIVSGARCNNCGGPPVGMSSFSSSPFLFFTPKSSQAPVVQWNKCSAQGVNKDRWSQTYVAKSPSSSPLQTPIIPQRSFPFPRPTVLASSVEEHIVSATNTRPSFPKHNSLSEHAILSAPDVIPSPYSSELSKVYGSVLQPKETLESFHCHLCSAPFTPDATIYPDPADASGGRYMCRPCFSQNGGSRGSCVECSRPVLILKSEGGFVENAGRVWHKKCFHCSGCGKSIGDNPVVDLLGRPSCPECFDTCLDRRGSPAKFGKSVPKDSGDGLRGSKSASPGKARKRSSTIEELEQVLGIRRCQSTLDTHNDSPSNLASASSSGTSQPILPSSFSLSAPNDDTSRSTAAPWRASLRQTSTPPRPITKSASKPTPEAVEAAKRRYLRQTGSSLDKNIQLTPTRDGCIDGDTSETPTKSSMRHSDLRLLRHKDSGSSIRTDRESTLSLSSAASTPSLTSDHSDLATSSSEPSSPPPTLNGEYEDPASLLYSSPPSTVSGASVNAASSSPGSTDLYSETFHVYTKLPDSTTYALTPLPDAKCAKCTLPLFDVAHDGRYVSVPEPSSTGSLPRMYHADCFRCKICNGLFEEKEAGRAVFVRGVRGACHLHVSTHSILMPASCS